MNLGGALTMGRCASNARSSENQPVPSKDIAAVGDGLPFGDLAFGLGLTVMSAEDEAEANDSPDLPSDGAAIAFGPAPVPGNLVEVAPETDVGGMITALPSQCQEGLMDRRHVLGSLATRSALAQISDMSPAAQATDVAGLRSVADKLDAPARGAPKDNTPMAVKAAPVRVSPSMESASTLAGFSALSAAGEITTTPIVATQVSRDAAANLTEVLGERMQWLHAHGVDRAVVNLRPHMAGHVQVELSHEAGALAIRLTATQRDVVQQLQTITEELRHELGARQFHGVSVQVAYAREQPFMGHGSAEQEQRHEQNDARVPGRALDTPEGEGQSFAMNLGGGSPARE